MSHVKSFRLWVSCLFKKCEYYEVYLKLIGPGRITHREYHRVAERAEGHLPDCPYREAKETCKTCDEWEQIWDEPWSR
jgi:hypothetical protein